MSNYSNIKNQEAPMTECFFAFSKKQFEEGGQKAGIQDKKILKADGGLFGTEKGITDLYNFYDAISARIGIECNPQEVYDYEFINHECSYLGNDEEAIKLVASYFTDEQTKAVKRKFARTKIENLKFN